MFKWCKNINLCELMKNYHVMIEEPDNAYYNREPFFVANRDYVYRTNLNDIRPKM